MFPTCSLLVILARGHRGVGQAATSGILAGEGVRQKLKVGMPGASKLVPVS
jgi:hypothetical protein